MNNYIKQLALVAVVGLGAVSLMTADQWDKKTKITTDEAMQLPNTTLQPGSYVIKLADLGSQRHIVQFFDKDETHLITTILAIPNERLRPTGKTVFAFWETPAGQPKALRAWFYPGDNFGQEFAYPKNEAAQITASNPGATVPINDEQAAGNQSTVSTAEPPPAPVATVNQAPPAPEPAPVTAAPVQTAQNDTPAPVAPDPAARLNSPDTSSDAQRTAQAAAPQTLPQTASNLPMVALIGLLSLLGSFALNLAYRNS